MLKNIKTYESFKEGENITKRYSSKDIEEMFLELKDDNVILNIKYITVDHTQRLNHNNWIYTWKYPNVVRKANAYLVGFIYNTIRANSANLPKLKISKAEASNKIANFFNHKKETFEVDNIRFQIIRNNSGNIISCILY